MLDQYSIEQRATEIFDTRTKEYFSEVLSCYGAGNYRSAVVMLWSVAVCDLLFKLQNLVDLHVDEKAKAILAEIGNLQRENERSPIWETKLVELVAEQTQLLDIAERENLLHLQRQRHLAAHPIITANFQLHRPNRETARALIRNTLDGLLAKAPILSKQIIGELVEDLEQASGILIDDRKLKAYLESKYFSRFNPESEKAVFKALWKFVFRLIDDRCEKNRIINYSALRLLFSRNPPQFRTVVEADKDYFSAIATEGAPVVYLIHFLAREPTLYAALADHAKTTILHTSETDASARCLAWFVAENLEEHANRLGAWFDEDRFVSVDRSTWDAMGEISDSEEWDKQLRRLANRYYASSGNYATADERFSDAIQPLISEYDIEDCRDLMQRVEANDQAWGRRLSCRDHRNVHARATSLDPNFDMGPSRILGTVSELM